MDFPNLIEWYLVFLFSTVLHEAAHAWTAWKLGDDTAQRGGQVTLDPIPHIRREPMGMVVVPIVSFLLGGWMIGWASAPYNRAWAFANPRKAGLMALTGPLANFAIVILAGIAIKAGLAKHYFQPPEYLSFAHMTQAVGGTWAITNASILSIAFSLNLLLGVFNLIPIPPLDGASLPLLVADEKMARAIFGYIRHPSFRFIGLIIAWNIFPKIFHPIQIWAANILYPGLFY